MSAFRNVVIAGIVTAAVVAACTSPSSPDAHPRVSRRFSVLTSCTGGNVTILPCNTSISAPANSSNDTITVTWGNTLSTMQGYDVSCDGDGTVVLSCTPEDTQITVPSHGNVHMKYHFHTRVSPGTGHLSLAAEDLNNGNFAGSTVTVTTH
jgi:hypothetical protein